MQGLVFEAIKQPAFGRLFAFNRARGFTLIELMVVLVLVGIVLTMATLSIGGDKHAEEIEREARRLTVLMELAAEEAVLRSEQLALRFADNSYEFMVLHNRQWLVIDDDRALRAYTLPDGVELRLELEENPPAGLDTQDSDLPQLFLLSSGEMTPFVITLSALETEKRFQLTGTLLGQLELEALE